jgi:hypothetical protein
MILSLVLLAEIAYLVHKFIFFTCVEMETHPVFSGNPLFVIFRVYSLFSMVVLKVKEQFHNIGMSFLLATTAKWFCYLILNLYCDSIL